MKDIVIIGAGGVGKETAWIIEQINKKIPKYNILGFIDDNEKLIGKKIKGYKVIGGVKYLVEEKLRANVVLAFTNYKGKYEIVKKLKGLYKFETIIHPDIYLDKTVTVGEGSIIYPQTLITTNIKIGEHVIVSPKVGIGHDSIIESYTSILWSVNISGNCFLDEGSFIGSGATVIQGIKIGKGAIVGAGAVVIKDILKNTTVVGVPAKVI